MLKKVLIGTGVAVLLGTLVLGRDLVSYMNTLMGWGRETVVDCVPLEFQIRRAKDMIEGLISQARQIMHVIAREEVEIEQLDQKIAEKQKDLDEQKTVILRMRDDLATGKPKLVYAGQEYSAEQVRRDLANRFERYKTDEATLASLEQIREIRQKSLQAARENLENTLAAKRQLEVEVQNLEARLATIRAAQASADYQFDDSQIGRIRQLLADLRARLTVLEKLAHGEMLDEGGIPVESSFQKDIVEEVTEHFRKSGSGGTTHAVAKAP